MIVYRLSKNQFKHDLSGKGAELAGGRWNSKGVAMLYTGESRSLCAMEALVHIPAGLLPKDYFLITISVPEHFAIQELGLKKLPPKWHSIPHGNATQVLGDQFIREGKNLLLKVPSAIVKAEYNYLFNPLHPDFTEVKILDTEPFEFDSRLFKVG